MDGKKKNSLHFQQLYCITDGLVKTLLTLLAVKGICVKNGVAKTLTKTSEVTNGDRRGGF